MVTIRRPTFALISCAAVLSESARSLPGYWAAGWYSSWPIFSDRPERPQCVERLLALRGPGDAAAGPHLGQRRAGLALYSHPVEAAEAEGLDAVQREHAAALVELRQGAAAVHGGQHAGAGQVSGGAGDEAVAEHLALAAALDLGGSVEVAERLVPAARRGDERGELRRPQRVVRGLHVRVHPPAAAHRERGCLRKGEVALLAGVAAVEQRGEQPEAVPAAVHDDEDRGPHLLAGGWGRHCHAGADRLQGECRGQGRGAGEHPAAGVAL